MPRRLLTAFAFAVLISLVVPPGTAKKKKKSDEDGMNLEVSTKKKKKSDEDLTQTLPPPKEAPSAMAECHRPADLPDIAPIR